MQSKPFGSRFFLLLAGACVAFGQQYSISTIAGGAPPPTPSAALSTPIGQPNRAAVDASGNVYFSSGNSVFRIAGSTVTLVAGNSRPGFSGDGGAAVSAQLNGPAGIAIDKAGNVYIADTLNNRVRVVNPQGIINTLAGNGQLGYVGATGDGGPATQAQLQLPSGVAADSSGNVYIADTGHNQIRKVTTDGNIATVAGDGYPGFFGDPFTTNIAGTDVVTTTPATMGEVNHPQDVAVDSSGNIFIADTANGAIRKVGTDGNISTVAGSPTSAGITYSGDGAAATSAGLVEPYALFVDSQGQIYIAERQDGRIRQVNTKGVINTIVGNGNSGFAGDNGSATKASLNLPTGMAVDSSGNIYIADTANYRIRKVSGGNISTIAGNGGLNYSGDNGKATAAQLYAPQGVAVDGAGNVYIADTANNVVRKVAANGTITTFAGTGTAGNGGDGAAATAAQLSSPEGVAVDGNGNVYIADTANSKIRRVTVAGSISTFAGSGTPGYAGDGAAAGSAQLNFPTSVAVDTSGNVYIADYLNSAVRKVTTGGTISTIAGTGVQGYSGDNAAGNKARLNGPQNVAVDSAGNVYIADQGNNRVRMVSASGNIVTIAGTGDPGFAGDGGLALNAHVTPAGVAVDNTGAVYISDGGSRVRKVIPGGGILTVAGTGTPGYSGDGGIATTAALNQPTGLATDSKGNVFIADTGNNAVREMVAVGGNLSIAAVTNGATNRIGAISPGEVLVLYGSGIGPANLATNSPNSNGVYTTTFAGTTVYINGIAAPILYTSAGQVSVLVPFGLQSSQAQIYITFNGQTSVPVTAPVAQTTPSLFTLDFSGTGQAAAVNQDQTGTINGPTHPANAGSFISLYGTGGGALQTAAANGLVAAGPDFLAANVTASIGGVSAPVTYAGAAPGSPYGVVQINVQIPVGLSAGAQPVVITIGGGQTQTGVTVYVSGK